MEKMDPVKSLRLTPYRQKFTIKNIGPKMLGEQENIQFHPIWILHSYFYTTPLYPSSPYLWMARCAETCLVDWQYYDVITYPR